MTLINHLIYYLWVAYSGTTISLNLKKSSVKHKSKCNYNTDSKTKKIITGSGRMITQTGGSSGLHKRKTQKIRTYANTWIKPYPVTTKFKTWGFVRSLESGSAFQKQQACKSRACKRWRWQRRLTLMMRNSEWKRRWRQIADLAQRCCCPLRTYDLILVYASNPILNRDIGIDHRPSDRCGPDIYIMKPNPVWIEFFTGSYIFVVLLKF